MIDFDVNADNFWGLVQAMSYKERMKHMRRAFAAGAKRLQRRAGDLLIADLKGVRDSSAMRKTIWTKVYNRIGGFRVTVAGNNHPYPSRMKNRGGSVRKLPLARWMEEGTAGRATKGGHNRGGLRPYKFLARANSQLAANVGDNLEKDFMTALEKTAKKYGCI